MTRADDVEFGGKDVCECRSWVLKVDSREKTGVFLNREFTTRVFTNQLLSLLNLSCIGSRTTGSTLLRLPSEYLK